MSHRLLLLLLSLVLLGIGLMERGWAWLAVWLGANFLALALAHGRQGHGLFGKRADGTLPVWSMMVFLPLLSYTLVTWHLFRLFSREPARNTVTEQLEVGRRLLASEYSGTYDNYLDLTTEFAEPKAIRTLACYRHFPILDGAAPTPAALLAAVDSLRPGRTFIHCAQGHGRTGLFALALLLRSGAVSNVEEGLRRLQQVRPGIRLSRVQRECIQAYAVMLAAGRDANAPSPQ